MLASSHNRSRRKRIPGELEVRRGRFSPRQLTNDRSEINNLRTIHYSSPLCTSDTSSAQRAGRIFSRTWFKYAKLLTCGKSILNWNRRAPRIGTPVTGSISKNVTRSSCRWLEVFGRAVCSSGFPYKNHGKEIIRGTSEKNFFWLLLD